VIIDDCHPAIRLHSPLQWNQKTDLWQNLEPKGSYLPAFLSIVETPTIVWTPYKAPKRFRALQMLLERSNLSNNVQKCCLGRHHARFCDTASIFTKVIAGKKAQTISITKQRSAIESNRCFRQMKCSFHFITFSQWLFDFLSARRQRLAR